MNPRRQVAPQNPGKVSSSPVSPSKIHVWCSDSQYSAHSACKIPLRPMAPGSPGRFLSARHCDTKSNRISCPLAWVWPSIPPWISPLISHLTIAIQHPGNVIRAPSEHLNGRREPTNGCQEGLTCNQIRVPSWSENWSPLNERWHSLGPES